MGKVSLERSEEIGEAAYNSIVLIYELTYFLHESLFDSHANGGRRYYFDLTTDKGSFSYSTEKDCEPFEWLGQMFSDLWSYRQKLGEACFDSSFHQKFAFACNQPVAITNRCFASWLGDYDSYFAATYWATSAWLYAFMNSVADAHDWESTRYASDWGGDWPSSWPKECEEYPVAVSALASGLEHTMHELIESFIEVGGERVQTQYLRTMLICITKETQRIIGRIPSFWDGQSQTRDPTPATRSVIDLINQGYDYNTIQERTGKTPNNISRIKSRYPELIEENPDTP